MQFTDAVGHTIEIDKVPERIVSLVPSQTELLCSLGLRDRIAGVTRFCIHPKDLRKEVTIVGGTKDFQISRIEELSPDLVLCNKEENTEKLVKDLQSKFPTYTTDVWDLYSAFEMIEVTGKLTHTSIEATRLSQKIKSEFESLPVVQSNKSAAYLIWKDPYMTVSEGTFISHMLQQLGVTNVINENKPYPAISVSDLKELNPDYVLLSSEPYPFKESDIIELKEYLGNPDIFLVDGEMFSWYGSRLEKFPAYFKKLRQQIQLDTATD